MQVSRPAKKLLPLGLILLIALISLCFPVLPLQVERAEIFGSQGDWVPTTLPHSFVEEDGVREYRLFFTLPLFAPKLFRLVGDDCVEQVEVNQKIVEDRALPFCNWRSGSTLDLSPYLYRGSNELIVTVRNQSGLGGFRISYAVNDPMHALGRALALLVFAVLLVLALPALISLVSEEIASALWAALGGSLLYHVYRGLFASEGARGFSEFVSDHSLREMLTAQGLVAGLIVGALVLLARRWLKPESIVSARIVWVAKGLPLFALLLLLFDKELWLRMPLLAYGTAILVLSGTALYIPAGFYQAVDSRLRRLSRRNGLIGLSLAVVAYTAYAAFYSIQLHHSLLTGAYDLAIQENVLWNIMTSGVMWSDVMQIHYLGNHTSVIYYLVAPLYWIGGSTEWLLALQSFFVALAAFPLYLIALHFFRSNGIAFWIAIAYLLHPAVAGANLYHFHEAAFAPLLLFFAFYLFTKERWRGFWVALLLLLCVKEDLSIVVVCFGAFLSMALDLRRGIQVCALGAVGYLFFQEGMIPFFRTASSSYAWYFEDLIPPGEGPAGLVKTAATSPAVFVSSFMTPEKALYFSQVYAPLLFASVLSLPGLVLSGYGLILGLASTLAPLHTLGFQYAFHMVPQAFIAAIYLFTRDKPVKVLAVSREALVFVALGLTILTTYHFGMFYPRHNFKGGFGVLDFEFSEQEQSDYSELQQISRLIPLKAPLLTDESLAPHFARRRGIHSARRISERFWPQHEYVLRDKLASFPREYRLQALLKSRFELVSETNRFLLYKSIESK